MCSLSPSLFLSLCVTPPPPHTQALRYWEEVRPRLQPDVLQRYWRLHLSAAVSALSLHRVDVNKVQDADRWVCCVFCVWGVCFVCGWGRVAV